MATETRKIDALDPKPLPISTDQLEIQEASNGPSFKVTADTLWQGGAPAGSAEGDTLAWDATGQMWVKNGVLSVDFGGGAVTVTGALTCTGAFTSPGIDDNANALAITINGDENVGFKNPNPSDYYSEGRDIVVGAGDGNAGISIVSSPTGRGHIAFADGTNVGEVTKGLLRYEHTNDTFILFTNDTEAARWTGSQVYAINGLASFPGSWRQTVNFAGLTQDGIGLDDTNGAATAFHMGFNSSGVQVGSITTSPTGTQFNQTSDPRVKTVFEPADPVIVMNMIQDFVTQKAIGKYKFLSEVESMGANAPDRLGFNAHLAYDLSGGQMGTPGNGPREAEVGSVYGTDPETGEDLIVTPWGVDHSIAVPHLVIAADYHEKRIAALESRATAPETA